jgi:alanyl-tRNA synthetase
VFASGVPLSIAREIEGVRAVFGESYPDPVRAVSIGMVVDKLISYISAKDWWKYSVEFCRGTHVDRAGETKELTVLQLATIAKGIRRIVAVTGREVRKIANDLETKHLVRLEQNTASTSFIAKLHPNSSTKAVSEAIKHVSHKN